MFVFVRQICGVSILRAGETMEPALSDVCKDVSLGKILIQTNLDTGEPEVSESSCMKYCTMVLTIMFIECHCDALLSCLQWSSC